MTWWLCEEARWVGRLLDVASNFIFFEGQSSGLLQILKGDDLPIRWLVFLLFGKTSAKTSKQLFCVGGPFSKNYLP